MNRIVTWLCAAALMCAIQVAPVSADSQSSGTTSSSCAANAPKAMAGFCLGFFVGTPIIFVRKLKYETLEQGRGLTGSIVKNENSHWLLVPASAFMFPYALLIAGAEAGPYAWRNAWMAKEPFSKEQFSLGEMDDPNASNPPSISPLNN